MSANGLSAKLLFFCSYQKKFWLLYAFLKLCCIQTSLWKKVVPSLKDEFYKFRASFIYKHFQIIHRIILQKFI